MVAGREGLCDPSWLSSISLWACGEGLGLECTDLSPSETFPGGIPSPCAVLLFSCRIGGVQGKFALCSETTGKARVVIIFSDLSILGLTTPTTEMGEDSPSISG